MIIRITTSPYKYGEILELLINEKIEIVERKIRVIDASPYNFIGTQNAELDSLDVPIRRRRI